MPNSEELTVKAAQQLLRQFMCIDLGASAEGLDHNQVQAALKLVAKASEYQILGICADDLATGTEALYAYLTALGYEEKPDVPDVEGAIYIKYNPRLNRCHAEGYIGEHRGVLVSCQSAYEEDINETFGHLPLDLFPAV